MIIQETLAHAKNFGKRKTGCVPKFLILHDTGGSAQSAIHWFQNPGSGVSAHYVVARDGTITRMVPEDRAAWHAGMSEALGYESLNDWSIGIEIEDKDADPYPDAQLKALLELCEDLVRRYRIPLNHVLGHCHIATPRGRKVDPGPDFDWFEFLNVLGARLAMV